MNKLLCAIGALVFVAGIGVYMHMISANDEGSYIVTKCQCPPGQCICPTDKDSCQCPPGHCTCSDDK